LPCDDKDGHFIPRAGETLGDPKRNQSKRCASKRLLIELTLQTRSSDC